MDESAATKFLTPAIAPSLKTFAERLAAVNSLSKEILTPVISGVLEEYNLKMGNFAQPLRVVLTGRTFSPGIHEVIQLLGKDLSLIHI